MKKKVLNQIKKYRLFFFKKHLFSQKKIYVSGYINIKFISKKKLI